MLKNSIAASILQLSMLVAGVITPRIIIGYYGSETNGLLSSINQFLLNFNLVEAGLSTAAIFSLYQPLATNNIKSINSILSATKKLYKKSFYIFVILTIVLSIIYPLIIDSSMQYFEIAALIVILGFNGAIDLLTLAKYRVILTADQKSYVISFASLVHIVINTILIITLANLGVDILLLKAISITSLIIRSMILYYYVRKNYLYLDYTEEPQFDVLSKRWDALYLQILGMVHLTAPVIILTICTKNLILLSIYSVYNMIFLGLNGLLGIFTNGLAASFGELISKNEKINAKKAFNEFELIYISLITIIYSVTYLMILPFIQLYVGNITEVSYIRPSLALLFVINGLLHNLKTPNGMLVISAGKFKETKIQTTIQGLIMVLIGFLLVNFFGIDGVLFAAILSNFYRLIDLIIFRNKYIIDVNWKKSVTRTLMSLITFCLAILYSRYSNILIDSPKDWIIYSILYTIAITIFVAIFTLLLDKTTVIQFFSRIISIIFARREKNEKN